MVVALAPATGVQETTGAAELTVTGCLYRQQAASIDRPRAPTDTTARYILVKTPVPLTTRPGSDGTAGSGNLPTSDVRTYALDVLPNAQLTQLVGSQVIVTGRLTPGEGESLPTLTTSSIRTVEGACPPAAPKTP